MRARLGANGRAAPRAIFDYELLTEPLRKPLRHQPREDIRCAACSDGDDDPHRPHRVALRPCLARCRRERCGTRGKAQKMTAWMRGRRWRYKLPPVIATKSRAITRCRSLAKEGFHNSPHGQRTRRARTSNVNDRAVLPAASEK